MTTEEAVSWGTEGLLFNAKDGFLEGIVRGCRAGLLTPADYANLAQCETLDDVKLHLCGTDYAGVIQNEPSPLHPSTIVARRSSAVRYLRGGAGCRVAGSNALWMEEGLRQRAQCRNHSIPMAACDSVAKSPSANKRGWFAVQTPP